MIAPQPDGSAPVSVANPRRWPWVVFFFAMLGGIILGRIAEINHIEAADRIETSTTPAYESRLDDIVVGLEDCYSAGECDGGVSALHPIEGSFEEVRAFWQATTNTFTPWLSNHSRVETELLRQARETIDPDGAVTDAPALRALLDGPVRAEFEESLADGLRKADRRLNRARMLTRVFGWGWKVITVLAALSPLAMYAPRRQRFAPRQFSA